MNPFQTATEEGYDNERIFDFLYRSYPNVRKKLKKALDQGYSAKEVIDFFSKQAGTQSNYGNMSQQAVHRAKREEDRQKNIDLLKGGLKLATNLALPFGISKGASRIGEGIAKGIKSLGTPAATNLLKHAEPEQIVKAVTPNMSGLLSKHNLLNKIERLASTHAPETLGAVLQKQVTPAQMQEIEQLGGKSFSEIVKDYGESFLEKAEKVPLSREGLRHQIQSHKALLSNGEMGEVKSEKQGIAEIETPSGIRRKKLDEVILEPQEAATQALELVKSFTPEQERSSHHAISAYDPEDKKAFFLFHNGSAYQVDDISPEEYERLSTEVDMAKTKGSSPYGVWSTGEGSRGAAYNEIVKKLKKPYRKLQVGYNILKEWQRLVHERTKEDRRKKPKRQGEEETL